MIEATRCHLLCEGHIAKVLRSVCFVIYCQTLSRVSLLLLALHIPHIIDTETDRFITKANTVLGGDIEFVVE